MAYEDIQEFWKNEDGINDAEIGEYQEIYAKTIETHMASIEDEGTRAELKQELTKHTNAHSTNGHSDASLNVLRAEKALVDRDNLRTPELKEIMDTHDNYVSETGKKFKTSAKDAIANPRHDNDAYLQHLTGGL